MRLKVNSFAVLCALCALCANVGLAQEEQQPAQQIEEETMPAAATEPSVAEAAAEEPAPIEEIVVTGSRIRRDAFTSASPIQVITSETSALAGLLNTADILQGSTVASGQQIDDSFSGFVTDGGPGSLSVALRGFGEQRTLVLVNGKRWGPSGVRGGTNSVDLTSIPETVISRYEILKDGASSIYGADAVAGVVNVITKERFDGFQINVEGLVPEGGGAENYVVDATYGKVGDDWSFNISAAYDRRSKMVQADRGWSACPRRPRFTDQEGDGVIDNTNPETGEPLCFGFIYGFAISPFNWVRYEPSLGQPDPSNPYFSRPQTFGIPYFTTVPVHGYKPGGDPADPDPLWDNEGAFYRDEREPAIQTFIPKRELYSITSFADKDFDIGGRSANAYYELYYNHRSNEASSYRQFFPVVPASNPTNPFGVHQLGTRIGRGFAARPVLPSYGIVDPKSQVAVDRLNLFVGLDGDISETWTYSAYAGYSYSNGTYKSQQLLDDRVSASLNATLDANGNVVCADNSIPGCVPANLFTEDALLRGQLPADVVAFLVKDTKGETTYKSYQFSGYVTGRLFEFPNGEDVNAVFGVEVRKEDINDVPDIEAQNNNFWGSTTAGITTGNDTVKELFSEVEVPLLKQVPLAEELIFNGSVRWTDYDSYGSDTTYRLALDYQVVSFLRLRGTYGTSFRAPDLYEQFLANQTGFVPALGRDPCLNYGDNYEPGDVVYQNCAAQGLPPDFGEQGSPSIRQVVGGNPSLVAETSDSWTAGIVIQPEEIGLSLAYTWFEIDLENTVAEPSASYILGTCYNSEGRSNPFCDRIAPRGADGFLTDIDASLLNVGLQATRGADFDFRYDREFSRFDLTIDGTVTRLVEQRTQLFDTEYDVVGNWGFPKWTGVADLRIDYQDWTFFWRTNFIGKSHEGRVFDPGTINVDRLSWTDNEFSHSISVRYQNSDWLVLATVRNLFDNEPPLVADGVSTNSGTRVFNTLPGVGYDLLGRSFVVQVAREF